MTFDEMEAALLQRLKAGPSAARAEPIHLLRLPDFGGLLRELDRGGKGPG